MWETLIYNISPKSNVATRYNILFAILVFIFFFIFYSVLHPLVPIDLDDWSFIVKNRIFLPLWGDRNPAKIFPEFLYPLMSSIGAYVIYPLNNDYLQSQCIIHAIVVSLSITGYALSFLHFIRRKFELSASTAYMLSILFLMLHFLIFRTEESNNIYMFYANDVNCYYNYIISDLLCASLVLSLLSNDWLKLKFQPTFKNSIIIVLLYLAICSNLYSSIIIGGYIVSNLIIDLINCICVDKNYIDYFKLNIKKIIVVSCWMIVHLFEASGQRAKESFDTQAPLFESIPLTLFHINDIYISKVFLLFFAITFIFYLYSFLKKQNNTIYNKILLSSFICFIYIVILSANVDPIYITGNSGNFSFFFYLLLFICIVLVTIIQNINKLIILLPFAILLTYSFINRSSNTFCDIWKQYSYKTLFDITQNNVNNIISADKANIKSIEITIPQFNNSDNWPLNITLDYSNALYKHNVIKRYVKVKLIKGRGISEWNDSVQSCK